MSMPAVLFVRDHVGNPQTPQVTLLPIDKQVLSTIATYVTNDKKRVAWPSVGTIAAKCWKTERSVQRSLSRLEKAKLLHREAGGGLRTTTYRIVGFSPIPEPGAPIAAAPPTQKRDTPPVTPVTPTPDTRVTPPPAPVTPPYKEYESTCEKTLKGEGTRPIEAVCMPAVPPLKSLAIQVIKNLSLPNVPGLVNSVEESISAEANYQHIEPAAAARFISDWCSEARASGVPINRFAFDDTIWRNYGSRKQSACAERFIHNARVVNAVFGTGIDHHVIDYQSKTRSLGNGGI